MAEQVTLTGKPKQKKQFQTNNLHYIRNADINLDNRHRFETESKVSFSRPTFEPIIQPNLVLEYMVNKNTPKVE